MDSDNSGSLQSSSGGDIEEHDSRAAAYHFLTTRPISANTPWPGPVSMRPAPYPSTSHLAMSPVMFQAPAALAVKSQNKAARKPRKRSRASRRAPTTVLATDTANFRAMVQEFTGIPAPPFDSSSFPRCRLDLFSTRSTAFEAPPFLVSSTPSNVASTPINYQLPILQNSTLFDVQYPNSLASLLQSNTKFLFSNSDGIISKPNDHYQICASTTSLTAMPNLVSSDQMKTTSTVISDYGFFNEKMNCAAPPPPPSGFRGGKGSENAATRAEGNVESWVFS